MTQYFTTRAEFGLGDIGSKVTFRLQSTASYSDVQMKESIEKTGEVDTLFRTATQLALVGWARGAYGSVELEDGIEEVTDVFDRLGVRYDNEAGTGLELNELTPKRLVRFFRHEISAFIKKERVPSFLSRKYSCRADREFDHCIFPCAEYMELSEGASVALLSAYHKMDARLKTGFEERAERVISAVRAKEE
jgi:hypothetical protein